MKNAGEHLHNPQSALQEVRRWLRPEAHLVMTTPTRFGDRLHRLGSLPGPLQMFYNGFNRVFGRATDGYVSLCGAAIRKSAVSILLLVGVTVVAGLSGKALPTSFLPDEDQGFIFAGLQLPDAASLQRTREIARQAEEIITKTPGVEFCSSIIGYNMLSQVQNTYSAFFFISLEEWSKRKEPEAQYEAIKASISKRMVPFPGP